MSYHAGDCELIILNYTVVLSFDYCSALFPTCVPAHKVTILKSFKSHPPIPLIVDEHYVTNRDAFMAESKAVFTKIKAGSGSICIPQHVHLLF